MTTKCEKKGFVLRCAACGRTKQTKWPNPRLAMELSAWALEAGWIPLWGVTQSSRMLHGSRYVQVHCSKRCANAQVTTRGTLRKNVKELELQNIEGNNL